MLRSMTGYGKASNCSPLGFFSVEIQSVNRKILDINITLPKELNFLTIDIRKMIESKLSYGQISVFIKGKFETKLPYKVSANLELCKQLHMALQSLCNELKLDPANITLETLLTDRLDIFSIESNTSNEEEWKTFIMELTQNALDKLIEMKFSEGKLLTHDFSLRLDLLENHMKKVELLVKDEPQRMKQKLLSKLNEFFPSFLDNEEKVMRELLIFAEKVDVQEEITRFYSHLLQFKNLISSCQMGIGKKMDFLCQEIGRELNTLGSKTQDLETTKWVVEMKTELSRIKEQLQNIE